METWSVLVVDDDPTYRAVLSLLVGHEPRLSLVGVAADGRTAIDFVQLYCPDVIILDVQMPIMDGLTALPRLRCACPDSVIALYSSDPQAAGRALGHGADLVADKAETPTALIERLIDLCTSARGNDDRA